MIKPYHPNRALSLRLLVYLWFVGYLKVKWKAEPSTSVEAVWILDTNALSPFKVRFPFS